jgi:NADH:ubiquinone oxidoreductase subunit E
MKIDPTPKFKNHVFVCCNERKDGTGCGFTGGNEIRDELRVLSKSPEFKESKLRVSQSGCLGRCEDGPVVVAYPKGEWVLQAQLPLDDWLKKL